MSQTASERLYGDSYYPLGRDPEWETRAAHRAEPVMSDAEAAYWADAVLPTAQRPSTDPWDQYRQEADK